jgi:beta-phosphoglucomutase
VDQRNPRVQESPSPVQMPDRKCRYDAVIFDVAGTLIGLHEWEPFQEFLRHVGLSAAEEDAHRFHRRLLSVIKDRRDIAQGKGADEQELDAWWRGNFSETWPTRPELADEMFRWLRAGRFDRLFSDTVPTLTALQDFGVPMGVLSNFETQLPDLLRRMGVRDYFDFVLVSSEVGIAKPDPRIFDLAVSKVDRPRHRLLYVGDHVGDDVEGARGAGLDVVLVDRRDHHRQAHCSRISSLMDLVHYIHPPAKPAPAIIFDMDGVVLDSMPVHLLTWQRTLAPLGLELTADELYPLEGIPTELTAKRLIERFLDRPCSDQEAQRLASAKRALFREIFKPSLVPGIGPLLFDLRGRGYQLGLVTGSSGSVVDESLVPTGVAGLFDAVVTGDQVTQGKPDPEPYRTAAARLDRPPSECLVVENAQLGIQSAAAAGMRCVALATTLSVERLSASGADQAFPDAVALRAWLLSQWRQD